MGARGVAQACECREGAALKPLPRGCQRGEQEKSENRVEGPHRRLPVAFLHGIRIFSLETALLTPCAPRYAMLLRFSVSNHQSVREKQELSLVASTSLKDEEGQLLETPVQGTRALRAAAIYGANASGKSNVLRSLFFMARAVIESQTAWKPEAPIPRSPFLLDSTAKDEPSKFDIEFVIDSVRYAYGFSLSTHRVEHEYLFAFPRGRQQVWFERDASSKKAFEPGKHLLGENKTIWALTRPNSLFLSAAAQNNHKTLSPIHRWFASEVHTVTPEDRDEHIRLAMVAAGRKEGRAFILRLLGAADLGIVDLAVEKASLSKKGEKFLEAAVRVMPSLWKSTLSTKLYHKAHNGGGSVPLDFASESNGTRALFALAPDMMSALARGGILCIDELEDSLHPILALEVLKTFTDPARNPRGAQLLFTTHNTFLLGERALRRDQVWFTEKNDQGATRLYPLTDFKPRRDENLGLGYLQGRYGAVPFLETDDFRWSDSGENESKNG